MLRDTRCGTTAVDVSTNRSACALSTLAIVRWGVDKPRWRAAPGLPAEILSAQVAGREHSPYHSPRTEHPVARTQVNRPLLVQVGQQHLAHGGGVR